MNKRIYLIGLIILLIPLVSALTLYAPPQSASPPYPNYTRYVNITFTNDTADYIFNITLLNSNGSYNRTLLSNINGTTYTTLPSSYTPANGNTTFSLMTTIKVYGFMDNRSSYTFENVAGGGDMSTKVIVYLLDNTTYTTSYMYNSFYTSPYNITFPNMSFVKYIEFYGNATAGTTLRIKPDNLRVYYNRAYFMYVPDENLSYGFYRVNVSGYNSSNVLKESNVSGLFTLLSNALLTINVRNLSGTSINSNINLSGSICLNSTCSFDVVNGNNYSLIVDNTSYSLNTTSITISSFGTTTQNITLLPNNAVNISIFREDNGSKAYGSASLTFVGDLGGVFYGSANQTNITANLDPDNYTLAVSLSTFDIRYYYVSVPNRTFQNLNVYMLNGTTVAFNFKAPSSAIIAGGLLRVYKYISGVLTLVESKVSDVTGTANVNLDPSLAYFFIASANGYNNYSFGLNPISETSYDITLESSTSDLTYLPLPNITGSVTYNNNTHILNFSYISTEPNVTTYFYTVSKIINSTPVIICSGTNTSLTKTWSCNTTGYNGQVYVQGVADMYIFYGRYNDLGTSGLNSIINQRDAGLFSGFIILILVLGGSVFGIVGVAITAIGGMIIIYWLGLLTPLSITMIIVGIIGSIIILLGIKRR